MSCQTIALYKCSPVDFLQARVVSLWLVIPIEDNNDISKFLETPLTQSTTDFQISSGLCSTYPGWFKYCLISIWCCATCLCSSS